MGRTATMLPGVRPSISLASLPTASTFLTPLAPRCTATTEGSFETIPLPLTKVSVVAVPRSMARSFENNPYTQSNSMKAPQAIFGFPVTTQIVWVQEIPRSDDSLHAFVTIGSKHD